MTNTEPQTLAARRAEADIALRQGLRAEIRARYADLAFKSAIERRPIYAEIRRLERLLDKACRLAR
jgi:hypothetical protein